MYAITSVAEVLHRYKTAKKKKSHSIRYVKYCTHCNHCMDSVHFHLLCFALVGTVAIAASYRLQLRVVQGCEAFPVVEELQQQGHAQVGYLISMGRDGMG